MKRLFILLSLVALVPATSVAEGQGLINKRSDFGVKRTLDRLENVLRKRGVTIVTRWNHRAKAKNVDIHLRPTELLIFGNPRLGSRFMTSDQTAGIDLPMKALAWKDENGQVWLTYNRPRYIANRHGIHNREKAVHKMTKVLNELTNHATRRN